MERKRAKLSKFDFSGENAAVALVSQLEGGAANGYKTLVLKSSDDISDVGLQEFVDKLKPLVNLDNTLISKMLKNSDEEYSEEVSDALTEYVVKGDITSDLEHNIKGLDALAEVTNHKITDLKTILKSASGEAPASVKQEDVNKSSTSPQVKEDTQNMAEQTVEELMKSHKELADLIKAKDDRLAALEKAQTDRLTAEYADIAKGLVKEDEEVQGMTVALMKASLDADMNPLVDLVKSQAELIKGMSDAAPVGHEQSFEDTAEDHNALIMKALAKQKGAK